MSFLTDDYLDDVLEKLDLRSPRAWKQLKADSRQMRRPIRRTRAQSGEYEDLEGGHHSRNRRRRGQQLR